MIEWGSTPWEEVESERYQFDNREERDGFLRGIEAAAGWSDYKVVSTDTDEKSEAAYFCDECGSADVEACLPAFFDPNENFQYCNFDVDADALYWHCYACGENVSVVKPSGDVESGRWG
jgi:hypothetical protein